MSAALSLVASSQQPSAGTDAPDLRAALRRAREERDAARDELHISEGAVATAKALVTEAEAKLATFSDLDARIAAERAQRIKAGVTNLALAGELAAAVRERRDAEDEATAAKAAHAILVDEVVTAKRAAAAAEDALVEAAEAVMLEHATHIAEALATTEQRAADLRSELQGFANCWLPQANRQPRAIKVTVRMKQLLQYPETPQPVVSAEDQRSAFRRIFDALLRDPDAAVE